MPVLYAYEKLLARRYHMESGADEIHRVKCADGATVCIKRFLPGPKTPRRKMPVLCVPGLGADSYNFDAPGQHGLAAYLAGQGFDVWAIDLRATGLSDFPHENWSAITFDDFFQLDLKAAAAHIQRRTESDRLLAMGHSMGGMLLYAMMATGQGDALAAVCTIASPLGFPQGWDAAPIFKRLWRLGEYIPGLHARQFLRLVTPLAMRSFDRAARRFAEVDNMDTGYARRLLFHAVQDIPRGVLLQFRDWIMTDTFRNADGSVDYKAGLAGVETPTMVVGAPADKMARLDSVERALPLLKNAEYLRCGTADGFSVDYGHIDVVFGLRARLEVFPHLLKFFTTHDRGQQPSLTPTAPGIH